MRYELKVFRFGPSDLGPEKTAELPEGWEPIGGEYEDGTLWVIGARSSELDEGLVPIETELL